MVDLAPFRGQRYAPDVVGDLAAVTAPPYDAISPEEQARLHAASPYNVVRLELAQDRPDDRPGNDRYSRAAERYRSWLADGALVDDAAARLHVYEQRFVDEGRACVQVGVLAALRVTPWDAGDVLPHEQVFRGPVEDRKRLLEALPANLSPVFVLASTTPPAVARLLDDVRRRTADAAFATVDGVEHRRWQLTDTEEVATVVDGYAATPVLMADGHHRYTTALEHHQEQPGIGTDRVLAYVVGADRGPVIHASHRLVHRLPADALERLRGLGFVFEPTSETPTELAGRLVTAPARTFGLVTTDGCWVLRGDGAPLSRLVADVPRPVNELDIALLQEVLLGPLEVPDRIEDLRYTADLEDAVHSIDGGDCDGLFLVRPVTFEQFRAASEAGVRMPPKSTTFVPKPRTGLVLRPLHPAGPP